jgi:hypothetical protein
LQNKVYTDEMQLPIYDAIKNLPRLDAVPGYTQIRAQNLGGNGQTVSQPDANNGGSNPHETPVNIGVCHVLSQPVASCQMERVKGIEPSAEAWEVPICPRAFFAIPPQKSRKLSNVSQQRRTLLQLRFATG